MTTRDFDHLYTLLRTAQKARPYFPNIEWIDYERLTMLGAVNECRADRGLTPLRTLADIERVEQIAAGHSDYTKKFALYCSELVFIDEIKP